MKLGQHIIFTQWDNSELMGDDTAVSKTKNKKAKKKKKKIKIVIQTMGLIKESKCFLSSSFILSLKEIPLQGKLVLGPI